MTASFADLPHGADLVSVLPSWAGVDRSKAIGAVERDTVTWSQADERTRVIAGKLGTLRGALGVVTDLVNDISEAVERAWADRYDQVLGYDSFEAFCRDRFGDLGLVRLPAPERAQLVLSLTGVDQEEVRCSVRGAARLMGIADQTARSAIAKARPKPLALVAPPVVVKEPKTRTEQALAALVGAGEAGLTIEEMQKRCRWTYAQTSPTLSRLHAQRLVVRLVEQRGAYAVYVAPQFAAGRDALARNVRRANA